MRLFVLGLVGLAVIAAAWWVVSEPTRVFGLDGDDLGTSLSREADAAGGVCNPDRGTRWRCSLETDPGSGSSEVYWLTTDSTGCWHAIQIRPGHPNRPFAAGTRDRYSSCVEFQDFVYHDEPGI